MCCFSQPVQSVSDTRIFARRFNQDRQYLAYSMEFATARPNAMILPLPIAGPTKANAVRFISLKDYKEFFGDIDDQFRRPFSARTSSSAAVEEKERLPVEAVGDFVASFVPTIRDFSRLDPRFVIKPALWKRLPRYADFGFAVFQLKAPLRKLTQIHPMALEFRTRLKDKLFFPTVHIHDGTVHPREEFDHQLYWQGRGQEVWTPEMVKASNTVWDRLSWNTLYRLESRLQPNPLPPIFRPAPTPPPVRSDGQPNSVDSERPERFTNSVRAPEAPITPVDIRRAKGIYSLTMEVHRWTIQEVRANEDIII